MSLIRWPTSKRTRYLLVLLASFVLIVNLAIYFRHSLPFWPQVSSSMRAHLPLHHVSWSLFDNSGICPPLQAYRGLEEAMRIEKLSSPGSKRYAMIGRTQAGLQTWNSSLGPLVFPRPAEAWAVRHALAQLELGAYPHLPVRPGDVVVDAGGFVGDWAKWAVAAGASKVIVFEPGREQLECLRTNLREELAAQRVILVPKGLWDREEQLYLAHSVGVPAADSVAVERPTRGESIELTTLDKALEELGVDRLDGLKMDIEGSEVRALQGASATLNTFRPVLAVATEHTKNKTENTLNVIKTMNAVAPFYTMRCGICTLDSGKVIPETLYFMPE
jgi:FkbM family methyltransferase